MRRRRDLLEMLFFREYFTMKEYYKNKSKKKKQPKSMDKKFEGGMDCKLRDLLLNTYFYGVCKNYCRQ
jgi:hypothetical protein